MKTNKKIIRLTESDLHNIIAESVNQILSEAEIENSKYVELLTQIGIVRKMINQVTNPFKINDANNLEEKEFLKDLYQAGNALKKVVNSNYVERLIYGDVTSMWDKEHWHRMR